MRLAPNRPRRGLLRGAAALAALALATGLITPPSSAVPADVSVPVTGSIDLNGNVSSLAGVVFQGTYDDETGDMVGSLVFPSGEFSVTSPAVATIGFTVTQQDSATGAIDLVTGDATFDGTLVLSLVSLALDGGDPGPLASCSYVIPIALTGSLDLVTNVLSLSETGITITVNPADGNPALRCNGLAAFIDPSLATSNNTIEAELDLNVTDAEPPAPAPDPEPVPAPTPPAAPPATPVAAAPQFTG